MPNEFGALTFWDHVRIAFRTKFSPNSIKLVGPARVALFALPDGTTFCAASPKLQQVVQHEPTRVPMPPVQASVVQDAETVFNALANGTSSSPELDQEFEDAMEKRSVEEARQRFMDGQPVETSGAALGALVKEVEALTESIKNEEK